MRTTHPHAHTHSMPFWKCWNAHLIAGLLFSQIELKWKHELIVAINPLTTLITWRMWCGHCGYYHTSYSWKSLRESTQMVVAASLDIHLRSHTSLRTCHHVVTIVMHTGGWIILVLIKISFQTIVQVFTSSKVCVGGRGREGEGGGCAQWIRTMSIMSMRQSNNVKECHRNKHCTQLLQLHLHVTMVTTYEWVSIHQC